jgi:type IV pilus assembly protein PilA
MKDKKGFTLIELMIVVAVIVILAVIAIPRFMRAKLHANEGDAIGALRTLSSAQTNFQASGANDADSDGTGEYGSFANLSNAIPAFIDDSLGSGTKNGYYFSVVTSGVINTDEIMWEASAYPIVKGRTGNRIFYVNESGLLRGSDLLAVPVGAPGVPATRAMAVPAFPPVSN